MCNAAATAVDAAGITKRFQETSALRDVTVTVGAGEIHGLLGPNGAGKTTLLRILLGLVGRDRGDIRLFGREIPRRPMRAADGVAAVLEGEGFYPYFSGRRNLAVLSRMDEISMTDAAIDAAIARAGLGGAADRAVGGYSAGMRQRLALAAALLRRPRLLLLDEPTSALDPAGVREIRALIGGLAAEGTTVILSSHDLLEIEGLCATVTMLREGEVVFSGTVDRLRALAGGDLYILTTSDDTAALAMAESNPTLHVVRRHELDGGLQVTGDQDALDRYVVALGRGGIAVRRLYSHERTLESVFLQLTRTGAPA
jgi:ABC-2 type transport system ATP-binding protein